MPAEKAESQAAANQLLRRSPKITPSAVPLEDISRPDSVFCPNVDTAENSTQPSPDVAVSSGSIGICCGAPTAADFADTTMNRFGNPNPETIDWLLGNGSVTSRFPGRYQSQSDSCHVPVANMTATENFDIILSELKSMPSLRN